MYKFIDRLSLELREHITEYFPVYKMYPELLYSKIFLIVKNVFGLQALRCKNNDLLNSLQKLLRK